MLSCEDVKNLLSAYYDGELGVAAQQQVAEHLAACEACREEYEQLKALSGAFGALTFPESDKAFRAGLHERLETEAKKTEPSGSVRFGGYAYLCGSSGVSCVDGWYLCGGQEQFCSAVSAACGPESANGSV